MWISSLLLMGCRGTGGEAPTGVAPATDTGVATDTDLEPPVLECILGARFADPQLGGLPA